MLPAVFIGGVDVAAACLEALCATGRAPALAIGYPPSLTGRSGYTSLAPVCEAHGVPLLETDDLNAPETVERIRSVAPGVLLVVAWSQLLGEELLGVATHGAVGMHPTALPEGRGRAPIPWTIIKGLRESAVTIFRLTPGVDDGPIVAQGRFAIDGHDDASIVYEKVRTLYVELLLDNIDAITAGTAETRPQAGAGSTWPRRRPEDGAIDWSRSAAELYDWVRGLTHPYPGAFTSLGDGRRLVVWAADLVELGGASVAAPGTVLGEWRRAGVREGGVVVAAGSDALALRVLQLEDGPELDAVELGLPRPGDVLG